MVPPNDFVQIEGRSGSLMQPVRSKDIHIPEPCHADWDQMRPEERGRYCFECKTKVHDLSAMTETEAEAFLRRTECMEVCISYTQDEDGALVRNFLPLTYDYDGRRYTKSVGLSLGVRHDWTSNP